jgi:hypothetical protein
MTQATASSTCTGYQINWFSPNKHPAEAEAAGLLQTQSSSCTMKPSRHAAVCQGLRLLTLARLQV